MNPAKLTTAIHSRLSEFLDCYVLIAFDVDGKALVVQNAKDEKSRSAIFRLMDVTFDGENGEEATDG